MEARLELKRALQQSEITTELDHTTICFKIFEAKIIQNFSEEICHAFHAEFITNFNKNGCFLAAAIRDTLIQNIDNVLN